MEIAKLVLPTPAALPARPPLTPEQCAAGRALLAQVRWEPSKLVQLALYAEKSPAEKVAQMVRIRGYQMTLMRRRLAAEHPEAPPAELNALVRTEIEHYYQR